MVDIDPRPVRALTPDVVDRYLALHQQRTERTKEWLSTGLDPGSFDGFLFQSLVEYMPESILCVAPDGCLIYANRAWLEMRGVTLIEAWGCQIWDLAPADEREGIRARLVECQELTPDNRVMQAEFATPTSGFQQVTYTGWFDRDGELAMISSVGRDRTEAHNARLTMAAANRRLEESNRDLQDFAYVASHDLQEPLRKIVAFSDRLATQFGADLDERAHDHLDRVQGASRRMQTLIDDLLTFSRVSTSADPMQPVDLADIIGEVVSDLEVALSEAGAQLVVGDLPSVVAARSQMRQLFQNLIGNAVKFRAADRTPRIMISAVEDSRSTEWNPAATPGWAISVVDNGIGFDQKYDEKIFTVFQRLHGRDDYAGSGIGLSVCRRIAERHHGELEVVSRKDEGSTFTVWIPA